VYAPPSWVVDFSSWSSCRAIWTIVPLDLDPAVKASGRPRRSPNGNREDQRAARPAVGPPRGATGISREGRGPAPASPPPAAG
jgi:hypothetical protein